MSGYIERPFSRPKWFTPLAFAWFATGLPAALVVPYFWITGTSPTDTPPPINSGEELVVAWLIRLLALAYVFGSPVLLASTDISYRRRIRYLEETNPNAPN